MINNDQIHSLVHELLSELLFFRLVLTHHTIYNFYLQTALRNYCCSLIPISRHYIDFLLCCTSVIASNVSVKIDI